MRSAACAAAVLVLTCAESVAQGPGAAAPAASWYDHIGEMQVPAPTKRALKPIPGYPQGAGGILPSGGTSAGASAGQSGSQYPASRNYYEYNPNAARPDSYGRMRSVGGPAVDRRGDQLGADWYRNMPKRNYDYRNDRY